MKNDPVNRFVMAQVSRERVRLRFSLESLAKGSGIPLGSLSNLVKGNYRCSLLNLYRLLSHLGLHISAVWPHVDGITPLVTDDIIRGDIEEAEARLPTLASIDDVLAAVAAVYGFSFEEMASPSRRRDLSEARAVAAQLVRERPHLKMVGLSEQVGRDVSTLFHCVRRMKWRLEDDPQLRERLARVRRFIP